MLFEGIPVVGIGVVQEVLVCHGFLVAVLMRFNGSVVAGFITVFIITNI